MDDFKKVLSVSELPVGSLKTVSVNGETIALANVGGIVYAVFDLCTHAKCSLGTDGFLEGNILTCGCHGAQFDVTSGKCLALPAVTNLKTYEVKTSGADVMVKI